MTDDDREVRYARAPAVWREVGGAMLVLPHPRGELRELSGSAPTIWSLLESPMSESEIVAALAEFYALSTVEIGDTVGTALRLMEDAGVVTRELLLQGVS